ERPKKAELAVLSSLAVSTGSSSIRLAIRMGSASGFSKDSISRRTTLGTDGRAWGCLRSLSRCMACLSLGVCPMYRSVDTELEDFRPQARSVHERRQGVVEGPLLRVLAEHGAQIQA